MNIRQGEIWEVEFFPNIGSEIGKNRPALVVNHDMVGKLPLRTVLPITSWTRRYAGYPWMKKLSPTSSNGLSKDSAVDCFQIRNFSINRFVKMFGYIDQPTLFDIHETVLKTLNPKYNISSNIT